MGTLLTTKLVRGEAYTYVYRGIARILWKERLDDAQFYSSWPRPLTKGIVINYSTWPKI